MGIDEESAGYLLLVDEITKILLQEGCGLLLLKHGQLVFDVVLFIDLLLQFLVASLGSVHDLGTDDLQRFVHWVLVCVPLEVSDVVSDGLDLLLASAGLSLDSQLGLLVEFFGC